MTSPIANSNGISSSSSSSSSSFSSSIIIDPSKKRSAADASENPDVPNAKRVKPLASDSTVFSDALTQASSLWSQYNNSTVSAALQPVLQSPLTEQQRALVKKLLETTKDAESNQKKDSAEIAQLSVSLYQTFQETALKEDSQKSQLNFLAKAIQGGQTVLIGMLLNSVSLKDDSEETYACILNAAQSTPEIACLILAKEPRIQFSDPKKTNALHYQLFKLALGYHHTRLLTRLLLLKLDIAQISKPAYEDPELVSLFIHALKSKSVLTDLILSIPQLHCFSMFFWYLIESNRRELASKIAATNKPVVQLTLTYAIESTEIQLPLSDKDKGHIDYFLSLGASLNAFSRNLSLLAVLLREIRRESELDQKALLESIHWFISRGASLTLYQEATWGRLSLTPIGEMGEELRLAVLKTLPRSYPNAKEVFQNAFICHDADYLAVVEIANAYADDLIDWQEALDYIVDDHDFSEYQNLIDFLKNKGAKLFGEDGENFLKSFSRYDNIEALRKDAAYSGYLSKTDEHGFGVLSHLVMAAHDYDTLEQCLEPLNNVASDLLTKSINSQDLFCAYLLLVSHKLALPKNFKTLAAHCLKQMPYSQMEVCKTALVNWAESQGNREQLKKLPKEIDLVFENFIKQNEFLTCVPVVQADIISSLPQNQRKEIAAIDYHEIIQQLFKGNPNESIVKEFLSCIKERKTLQNAFYYPKKPPQFDAPFDAVFKSFEKSCRTLIPAASYIKILGSFKAYFEHDVVIDNTLEPMLKSLKAALNNLSGKETRADMLLFPLRQFVEWEIAKEHFYLDLEDRLRVILYPIKAVNAVPAKTAEQLLNAITTVMPLCTTMWAEVFQSLFHEAFQKITGAKEMKPCLSPLESRLNSLLTDWRRSLFYSWAEVITHHRVQKITSPEIQKREHGRIIHYALAALKHCGRDYGIPRADMTEDSSAHWTSDLQTSLEGFLKFHYYSSNGLVERIRSSMHALDQSLVCETLAKRIMDNWNLVYYNGIEGFIVSAIDKILDDLTQKYEAITSSGAQQKEKELEETLFVPIWDFLSKQQEVTFDSSAVKNAIIFGKSYTNIKTVLAKIVKEACLKSRKLLFFKILCDEKGLIKPMYMRAILLDCNLIVPTQPLSKELNL